MAVIEVYSGPAFIWAEICGRFLSMLGKPFVLALHGGNLPGFAEKNPKRVSGLFSKAGKVVTPSHFLRNAFISERSDMEVIPNGIEVKEAVQIDSPAPNLTWLRAFHEIYNPSLAIEVIKLLEKGFPGITLTMYGSDKGDGSFQKTASLAKELRVSEKVIFVGQIPKESVQETLAGHSIFLNTTNIDNTPVSVIEAMAAGLCIVSTNVGGIPDLLEHERTALLVPPNDAQVMADAVTRILTEEGLAEELSANARREAEKFSWDVVIPQWERLFEEVVAEHRARSGK
jgi:glycosyltransferase involved in cell wall biosynthesis